MDSFEQIRPPGISLSASHNLRSSRSTLGSGRCRHQTLFRDSHISSGDWRTACAAYSGSADYVAWPHRTDSAPLIDRRRVWLPVLSCREIRRSVQIASPGHPKFIGSICRRQLKRLSGCAHEAILVAELPPCAKGSGGYQGNADRSLCRDHRNHLNGDKPVSPGICTESCLVPPSGAAAI